MSDTTIPATTLEKPGLPTRLRAAMRRLYRGETKFDFVRRRRWWFIFSSVVIIAGAVSLAVRGLDYSIEFVGGTSWEVASPTLTVDQVESAVAAHGLTGATVVVLAGGGARQIQVEAKIPKNQSTTAANTQATVITNVLAGLAHTNANAVSVEQVGPSWGGEITHKAVEALIVFFIVIALYISIFFEWKMALAAIIAVIHDILVTVGVYSLSGFLVTPDTVVAFLTILGYSLYDTIVVFDRIRDNTKGLGATGRLSYTDVVNLSMNQTLARSINTSLVAVLPILAVLVLGADILGAVTLQYFGLALLIGLTSGAYSSIFIASPLVAIFKEREPRYVSIREKLAARGTTQLLLTPAAVAAGALGNVDGQNLRRRGQKSRPGGGGGGGARSAGSGRLQPGGGARPRPSGASGVAARRVAESRSAPEPEIDDDLYDDELDEDIAPAPAPAKSPTRSGAAGTAARSSSAQKRPAGPGGGASAARRPPPRPRKKGKKR